jgi:hypothetical protein
MDNKPEILLKPEKYGYSECPHCNVHGSSLREPEGVNICMGCGEAGLCKKEL